MRTRVSPREIEAFRKAIEPEERAAAEARMRAGGVRNFRRGSEAEKGRVLDRVGQVFGVSGRHVEKIAEVYAAFESDPERFGAIVADMNRTGKVDGAFRKVRRAQDEDRVRGLAPIEGRFRTLILDPPWEDESVSEAQRPPYATMPLEEIRALPVPAWADDPCHLYLWIPNNFLGVGFDLIREWGFAYKTVLTWEKPAFTNGRYFRTNTEHVLFAVRGHLMTRSQAIGTRFAGPMGELHSEKPDSFYGIVEAASYPPYGEGFQRRARPGFTNLYAPIGALEAAE